MLYYIIFYDTGHSKDSGTGDSGQQSSDDLLLEDDHGLLIETHSAPKFGGSKYIINVLITCVLCNYSFIRCHCHESTVIFYEKFINKNQ